MKLQGKAAIVTGAGRGIGKAIALAFAKEGAKVIVVSRTLPEVRKTASEIESLGSKAIALKADVSNGEDVQAMVTTTLNEFGTVDILVNNAGVLGPIGPVWENDNEGWLKAVHINLIGAFLCCRAVLSVMIEKRQGHIINLSGGGAAYGRPFFSAYASSKAALVRFTECVAEEVKPYNIRVNAIAPGLVSTRMQDEVLMAGPKAGEEALAEARLAQRGGGVSPELAASLAVFLTSEESDGITGRLISAVWDDWKKLPTKAKLMENELYTLRRIDGHFFTPVAKFSNDGNRLARY